jgi:hypothetical protein
MFAMIPHHHPAMVEMAVETDIYVCPQLNASPPGSPPPHGLDDAVGDVHPRIPRARIMARTRHLERTPTPTMYARRFPLLRDRPSRRMRSCRRRVRKHLCIMDSGHRTGWPIRRASRRRSCCIRLIRVRVSSGRRPRPRGRVLRSAVDILMGMEMDIVRQEGQR